MSFRTVMITAILLLYGHTGGASERVPRNVHLADHPELIFLAGPGWEGIGLDSAAHRPDEPAIPIRISGKTYPKGLGCRVSGTFFVDLNSAYTSFEAEVGVQQKDTNARKPAPKLGEFEGLFAPEEFGPVIFKAFVDGEMRFDSGIMQESTPAKPVKISLAGARELKLVVENGKEGKNDSLANWANAILKPAPAKKGHAQLERIDLARFARILTWDPLRMEGARNKRLETFPEKDLFPESPIPTDSRGLYRVPTYQDGVGCIGLEWLENRRVNQLSIDFAKGMKPPPLAGVQIHAWVMPEYEGPSHGYTQPVGTRWQGRWVILQGHLQEQGSRWIFDIDWKNTPDWHLGTMKIRWVIPPFASPVQIRNLSAYAATRWETADVLLQAESTMPGEAAQVEIYNGEIRRDARWPIPGEKWKLDHPLRLKILYSKPRPWQTERTEIRLKLPKGEFAVAVNDLLTRECVYVRDFGVFAAKEPLKITLAEIKSRIEKQKTILEKVRELPDQTFAQAIAARHHRNVDLNPTVLSLANDNNKFVLYRNGAIEFDTQRDASKRTTYPYQLKPVFGSGKSRDLTRQLQNGWMPMPVINVKDGDVLYRQRTYVAPYDQDRASERTPSWYNRKPLCTVEFTVENQKLQPVEVSLKLQLFAKIKKDRFAIYKSYEDGRLSLYEEFEGGHLASIRTTVHGALFEDASLPLASLVASSVAPLEAKIHEGGWHLSGTLPAGARAHCVVYIPGWDATSAEMTALPGGANLSVATEAYWKQQMESAMQIAIPDPMLLNAINASRVHCLLAARNEEGQRIAPWIASLAYGPLDSEANPVINGMQYLGHEDFARRALDYFISKYNSEGFLTTGYTTMGTGWHLWTLGDHYALFGNRDWMQRVAPEVTRVCRYVMAQREKTKKVDAKRVPLPESGLMPPGVLADLGQYFYHYYLNGAYYAGLQATGKALKDINPREAESILKSADELREATLRGFRLTQALTPVLPMPNGAWLPGYSSAVNCPGPIHQWGLAGVYDVEVGPQHLVAMGVMDAHSREADWMINHMEDVQFIPGVSKYFPRGPEDWFNTGGFSRAQPYYARTAEIYALRDDVKPFIRSYFNTIAGPLNLEDLSVWENMVSAAWCKTHETGYFLHQSRLMLLMERDDQLWLAPFVTNNWMKDGMVVGVKNAPSYFGNVSYQITSHVKDGYIEAVVQPPSRKLPKELVVRLRHPEGKALKQVLVNGVAHTRFDVSKETITVRAVPGGVTVRALY